MPPRRSWCVRSLAFAVLAAGAPACTSAPSPSEPGDGGATGGAGTSGGGQPGGGQPGGGSPGGGAGQAGAAGSPAGGAAGARDAGAPIDAQQAPQPDGGGSLHAPTPSHLPNPPAAVQPLPVTRQGGDFPSIPATAPQGQPAPVAGQECPAWLHDAYITAGPDGNWYRTWHPPTDPTHRCSFGHEHGSDPRQYAGFSQSGMPAFGYTAKRGGFDDRHPYYAFNHNAQKVLVATSDGGNRPFMLTASLGSAPERVFIRYHALDWHMVSGNTTLVNVHRMADFGGAYSRCGDTNTPIPGSDQPAIAGAPSVAQVKASSTARNVFTAACVRSVGFETWTTTFTIGNFFSVVFSPGSHNLTTTVDVANPAAVHFTCEYLAPTEDCRSTRTRFHGDEHTFSLSAFRIANNSGGVEVPTDALGRPVARAQATFIQYLTTTGISGNGGGSYALRPGVKVFSPNSGIDQYASNFSDGTVHYPN